VKYKSQGHGVFFEAEALEKVVGIHWRWCDQKREWRLCV